MGVGSIYILLAVFLVFAVVLKGFSNQFFGVKTATILVVLVPFVLIKSILLIIYSGYDIPLVQAFGLKDLVQIVSQLTVAFVMFRLLDQTQEWLSLLWIMVGVIGAAVLYLAIPSIIGLFMPA